jgi:hypothetical protein
MIADRNFSLEKLSKQSGNSVFTIPDWSSRNFDGATTKKKKKNGPPYGPALAFGYGAMDSDPKAPAADVGASDAGGDAGGMGESIQKFRAFVESLRTDSNENDINTILEGFSIIIDNK